MLTKVSVVSTRRSRHEADERLGLVREGFGKHGGVRGERWRSVARYLRCWRWARSEGEVMLVQPAEHLGAMLLATSRSFGLEIGTFSYDCSSTN